MTQLQQNFQLGLGVAKSYTMKGLTQVQANGKSYINGLTEIWVKEYQYSTIKKQIGFLKNELKIAKLAIKETKEDLEYAYGEEKKYYAEELEKFLMAEKILTDMVGVMVGA